MNPIFFTHYFGLDRTPIIRKSAKYIDDILKEAKKDVSLPFDPIDPNREIRTRDHPLFTIIKKSIKAPFST